MRKIYHPYELWEDWKAGLYDLEREYDEYAQEEICGYVKEILGNPQKFRKLGSEMLSRWKYSAEVNLSNKSRNRQAWIGQATCCFRYGFPERMTKLGWNMLTTEEQKNANKVADELISIWESENAEKI